MYSIQYQNKNGKRFFESAINKVQILNYLLKELLKTAVLYLKVKRLILNKKSHQNN
jgi:hypothetical protein